MSSYLKNTTNVTVKEESTLRISIYVPSFYFTHSGEKISTDDNKSKYNLVVIKERQTQPSATVTYKHNQQQALSTVKFLQFYEAVTPPVTNSIP
jgi:hypothetical protein